MRNSGETNGKNTQGAAKGSQFVNTPKKPSKKGK
jgi:hypothetical protein